MDTYLETNAAEALATRRVETVRQAYDDVSSQPRPEWVRGECPRCGRSYFPLCPACRARSAQARREREPRAALLRVLVEGMAAQGLTEHDLHTAARSGHDIFGIQALPEKVWVDWLLCMEGAANSLPARHPLRSLLHAVRPTSTRVRTAFRRAQKAATLVEGRPLPHERRIDARRRASEALALAA